MSSLGIMTLTRAPCELDKMSLFQDLKLKRRKVDSRCSSDGESVADTSTSSPDLVGPPSPKIIMSSAETMLSPPSPDSTPLQLHPLEPTLDNTSSRLEDSGVFDGGGGTCGGGGGTGASVIRALPHHPILHVRSHSPSPLRPAPPASPALPPRPHSSPGQPATTITPIIITSNASPVIIHNPSSSNSSTSSTSSLSTIIAQHQQQQQQLQQQQQQHQQQQQQQHTATEHRCSPPIKMEPTSSLASSMPTKNRGVIISHPTSIAHTQSQLWLKHSRINGVKPELIGGSFGSATATAAASSIGHYGGTDIKPGALSPLGGRPASTAPVRQTPTVIMGEAGGVRTMVWSHPTICTTSTSLTIEHTLAASPGSSWGSSSAGMSNSEESAAQLLLNLGQDRLRPAASSPGHHRTSPSAVAAAAAVAAAHFTTSSPLNMERLWAGDLRQLPPNQQTHALNLTSPPPPPTTPAGLYYAIGGGGGNSDAVAKLAGACLGIEGVGGVGGIAGGSGNGTGTGDPSETIDEEEQPMICMICEDKATGLHYGIITCEGCKGFFKRTVQNRRVYTCVADGNCEITKAQRNRCQYCRFKKCIEQGMVLQAVREDRMPGGRNSGAVYNLYKVKYKKHKKPTSKQQQLQQQQQQQQQQQAQTKLGGGIGGGGSEKSQLQQQQHQLTQLTQLSQLSQLGQQFKAEQHQQHQQQQQQQQPSSIPANLVNGTILKTALTNPSEVVRLRQRLDSAVSSSRDRNFSIEYSMSMIKTLIDCDEFQDIATLHNLDDLLDHNTNLGEKLCHIGDSIVYKLVQWTKRLPFYLELPVEVHTRLLTQKWHELLVLTTSAYQAIHKAGDQITTVIKTEFNHEVEMNLCTLQHCLASMMGHELSMEQLRNDVGLMIEKITHVTQMFRQIKLNMEEYVCLKVIAMLNHAKPTSGSGNSELEIIHERYMTCLRVYIQHMYPQQNTRFQDLLGRLPEIQSAASLLLESKMFYVPFLLNSAIQR